VSWTWRTTSARPDLCGLAAPRGAGDEHHLVRRHLRQDLTLELIDGELVALLLDGGELAVGGDAVLQRGGARRGQLGGGAGEGLQEQRRRRARRPAAPAP